VQIGPVATNLRAVDAHRLVAFLNHPGQGFAIAIE
jgi:hypothetical protein